MTEVPWYLQLTPLFITLGAVAGPLILLQVCPASFLATGIVLNALFWSYFPIITLDLYAQRLQEGEMP